MFAARHAGGDHGLDEREDELLVRRHVLLRDAVDLHAHLVVRVHEQLRRLDEVGLAGELLEGAPEHLLRVVGLRIDAVRLEAAAFLTRTTRPGADSGENPAGGCAARPEGGPASAACDPSNVAAAAAPPRKARRDASRRARFARRPGSPRGRDGTRMGPPVHSDVTRRRGGGQDKPAPGPRPRPRCRPSEGVSLAA